MCDNSRWTDAISGGDTSDAIVTAPVPDVPDAEAIRAALVHLATRRHAFNEYCEGCRNVGAQLSLAFSEPSP
jgi:hypothetical protein